MNSAISENRPIVEQQDASFGINDAQSGISRAACRAQDR
jgi:hypothetical protein